MAEQRLEEIRKIRLERVEQLREMGIDPYPSSVDGDPKPIVDARNSEGGEVEVAGRIMGWRGHGNVSFADIKDESGEIQLWFQKNNLGENFKLLKYFDMGDFIYVKGTVTKTKAGELTIDVNKFQMLTKSVRPLPSSFHGLKDIEERFRRRYLDILLNPSVKEMFERKAKFWEANRRYLKDRGFLEVETPILEHVTGGADAKPFITHHNALDEDFYLRISTELYQKRLIGAGFEKVFVLGPNFRNEGIDDEHLQEYTQIEWYWAYTDYRDMMSMVKDMFRYIAKETFGKTKFNKDDHEFDLSDDWDEIDYVEIIKEKLVIDVMNDSEEKMKQVIKDNGVELDEFTNRARLSDNLWKIIRKEISGPAFLINEPKFVSPLAKSKPDDPVITERFHVIIGGSELGNGYTELNDPIDQLNRFQEQQSARDAGDDESQMLDMDYVEMLEYGMPPTSGYAHSERVFWYLEGVTAREGVLFPQMKRKIKSGKKDYDYKEKKIVVVLDNDLPKGLASNALGHIAFSAGHYSDISYMGQETIEDASGTIHKGISRYPFIVLGAVTKKIKDIVDKSKKEKLQVIDYTNVMFETGRDDELVKKMLKTKSGDLKYHAVLLAGESSVIDSITKGLKLYGK